MSGSGWLDAMMLSNKDFIYCEERVLVILIYPLRSIENIRIDSGVGSTEKRTKVWFANYHGILPQPRGLGQETEQDVHRRMKEVMQRAKDKSDVCNRIHIS